jgi:transposase
MMVGGLDVHRKQITFNVIDVDTGEVKRGRITPADRAHVRHWAARFDGVEAAMALEGCTGWRYVVEELQAAGVQAHVAEPADTARLRGSKARAKTDRTDARLLRDLLLNGWLPESWIPPTHVLEARNVVRLYKALLDDRTAWSQRVQATLFHQGVPVIARLRCQEGKCRLAQAELSPTARKTVQVGLAMMDALDVELEVAHGELARLSRRQPGCRALRSQFFGVGEVTAVGIWAELGDCRRFGSSDQAVRHTGLDITVRSSDDKGPPGHLARQGPPVLRWALFEAAKCAARPASPDHDYYAAVRRRVGAQRATLSVARKLVRRCHHVLRNMGDLAWEPATR